MIPLGILASARMAAPSGGPAAITDSFNRLDSDTLGTADTGQAWVNLTPGIRIISNVAKKSINGDGLSIIDFGQSDMAVSTRNAAIVSYNPQLLARSTADAASRYYVMVSNSLGYLVLGRRINGVSTSIASNAGYVPYTLGDVLTLSLKESGESTIITTFINGVQKHTYTDTTPGRPAGTYAGILINGTAAAVDEFEVVAP